jgi:hypothetical protein
MTICGSRIFLLTELFTVQKWGLLIRAHPWALLCYTENKVAADVATVFCSKIDERGM